MKKTILAFALSTASVTAMAASDTDQMNMICDPASYAEMTGADAYSWAFTASDNTVFLSANSPSIEVFMNMIQPQPAADLSKEAVQADMMDI